MKVIGVGDPKVLKHAQHVITGFASFRFADLLEILKQE